MKEEFRIAVIAGDGSGPEVTEAALAVLNAVERRVGCIGIRLDVLRAGAAYYRESGTAISDEALDRVSRADAVLLGPTGLPGVRRPDGMDVSPVPRLRQAFGLFAGMHRISALPHAGRRLIDDRAEDIDFLVVRDTTEGLFLSRGSGATLLSEEAQERLGAMQRSCEPLFDLAFEMAQARKERGRAGRVTCVDKANVIPAMAFFRRTFHLRAERFPGIARCHGHVDGIALDLARQPWELDVLVTEALVGELISDLAAGLVGGPGVTPCAEIGAAQALFRPAHGSAPQTAGLDLANPTAMIRATAMMLEWLAERHGFGNLAVASRLIDAAVREGYRSQRVRPVEFGGDQGTAEVAGAVLRIVEEMWSALLAAAERASGGAPRLADRGHADRVA